MDVLVLGGGNSTERDVSLRSAKAVADAARTAGFNVQEADPVDGLEILNDLAANTIVLPILHGEGGEDGALQAELEKRNLPYLGSDSKSSANCFDKWITRKMLSEAGLPVARGALVVRDTYSRNDLAKQPHVLKVVHGGSSIGTLIVRNVDAITQQQINELFGLEGLAVLEELVEGIEATVPILDQVALTTIEIVPPEGAEFDYDNKYNGKTQEICPPKSLSAEVQDKAKSLSEKVHKVMDCRHLSRVDVIVKPGGEMVVLEINTIPGLTNQSLFPKSAAVSGMDMPKLITKFIEMVKRDYNL